MADRFGRHPVSRRMRCKSAAPAAWQQQFALDAAPELCVENGQARKVTYLVTLSHPHNTHSQCGARLRVLRGTSGCNSRRRFERSTGRQSRQTDTQIDEPTNIQTAVSRGERTDRQTDRQADRQTSRQTYRRHTVWGRRSHTHTHI